MNGTSLASRGYAGSSGGGGVVPPGLADTIDENLIRQTCQSGRAFAIRDAMDEIVTVINQHAGLVSSTEVDPDILDPDSDIGVAKIVHDALLVVFAALNDHAAVFGGTDIDVAILEQSADAGYAETIPEGIESVIAVINLHAVEMSTGGGSPGVSLETRGYAP